MTVNEAEQLVRAVTHPYPGAYAELGDRKIIVWLASRDNPGSGNPLELHLSDGSLWAIAFDDQQL